MTVTKNMKPTRARIKVNNNSITIVMPKGFSAKRLDGKEVVVYWDAAKNRRHGGLHVFTHKPDVFLPPFYSNDIEASFK